MSTGCLIFLLEPLIVADAKRWLSRQQLRLVVQAEHVRKERSAVAELLMDLHALHDCARRILKITAAAAAESR
jgi:hypothetical protein